MRDNAAGDGAFAASTNPDMSFSDMRRREPGRGPAAPRRTFAIISHPDAGKTTLTEKLLFFWRRDRNGQPGESAGVHSGTGTSSPRIVTARPFFARSKWELNRFTEEWPGLRFQKTREWA
jgi:peptide subunit release factor RF-3